MATQSKVNPALRRKLSDNESLEKNRSIVVILLILFLIGACIGLMFFATARPAGAQEGCPVISHTGNWLFAQSFVTTGETYTKGNDAFCVTNVNSLQLRPATARMVEAYKGVPKPVSGVKVAFIATIFLNRDNNVFEIIEIENVRDQNIVLASEPTLDYFWPMIWQKATTTVEMPVLNTSIGQITVKNGLVYLFKQQS